LRKQFVGTFIIFVNENKPRIPNLINLTNIYTEKISILKLQYAPSSGAVRSIILGTLLIKVDIAILT